MKIFMSDGYSQRKEKSCLLSWITTLDPAIKRKVIMRTNFIALLLISTMMQVYASANAQNITLSVKDAPLKQVFESIKKQSGFKFLYNNSDISRSKPLTLSLNNTGLKQALEKCLEDQPLSFEILDKTIVIKLKPESLKSRIIALFNKITINGKVVDEKGNPLSSVTVKLKGADIKALTNESGKFTIEVPDENAVLELSIIGYETISFALTGNNLSPTIILKESVNQLDELMVVNTGYQTLPKERATGSFVQIDNKLINRRVSTNILDRLDGITSGLIFNGTASKNINTLPTTSRNLGINIRGESTILSSKDPLIVVDNFPYEGDIRNINPNDVESVTILKDASAASIWGAKAGNGVIVITTKKGKPNEKMQIELNSNLSIAGKPNLFKDKNYMSSSQFIEVEKYLFDRGLFNTDITNITAQTPISPVVEILSMQRAGTITLSQAEEQMNFYRSRDVRNDFDKYVYQKSISQQYSLAIRGGGLNSSYALSIGYDQNRDNIYRNGYDRLTINSSNSYSPIKNLEITAGLNYSLNHSILNNQNNTFGSQFPIGTRYLRMAPYASFIDESGNPASYTRGFKTSYINQTKENGFFDWNYRPLDELNLSDNSTKINDILFRVSAKYKILPYLSAEANYQNEHQIITGRNYQNDQTYYTRDLINKFSQYNATTKTFTYIFPLGGILNNNNYDWNSNSFRGQVNYEKGFTEHHISAIAGAEIRENTASGYGTISYGYDPQFGTSVMALNYGTSYQLNPSGTGTIASPDGSIQGYVNRFISYYANAGYSFKEKYLFNISGRKDGSNIFGANTNKRITPLWSVGLGWHVNKEDFFNLAWLPYLKLRATYGYNGNIGNTSALLTGRFLINSVTNNQYVTVITAPNPELRWERVRNMNVGVDFGTRSDILKGTVELYQKDGVDLLQQTPLAPQTGFTTFISNAAKTRTKGIDITLHSNIIKSQVSWSASLLSTFIKDKLLKYDLKQTSSSIQTNGGMVALVGKPMYSIFSYKWAGLDAINGDPLGYFNGKASKDYSAIQNNFNPDSLIFHGSSRPTVFGSFRNEIAFRGFALSINIVYKLGYYFRRPSLRLNYQDILSQYRNTDYALRWQNPGDEKNTNVPSLVYPSNTARNNFYQYSEVLVERGDHIRLQDVRLSYDFRKNFIKGVQRLQIYGYLNNLGIIWRENKHGIDPDFYTTGITSVVPNPISISAGINVNF